MHKLIIPPLAYTSVMINLIEIFYLVTKYEACSVQWKTDQFSMWQNIVSTADNRLERDIMGYGKVHSNMLPTNSMGYTIGD